MNLNHAINTIFYRFKPLIPRSTQIHMRRIMVKQKRRKFADRWPILQAAGKKPEYWPGWPEGKRLAMVFTHDVESAQGVAKCTKLARMERELGFRSSFNFVAKKYTIPDSLPFELRQNGFEIGVHGVYHDGKLFQSEKIFNQRVPIINHHLEKWQAVGFRAPAMHHNLAWLHKLNISYDLSTFDTDPFEPQSDGVSTIFPFWVGPNGKPTRYLEIPYTLVQDFTLFILMKEKTPRLWQMKLDWIAEHGGMALLNTHPDYMSFDKTDKTLETYPVEYYLDFLKYVKTTYEGQYWNALPKSIFQFYDSKISPLGSEGGTDN